MPARPYSTPKDSSTVLSDLINQKMDEKNLSIRGLSEMLDMTYEHARRIVKGESPTTTIVLRSICQVLDMDFAEAQKLSIADKIKHKYGGIPAEISGKNPELEPIERVWSDLTASQRRDAIVMIQGWAKQNRLLKT